MKEKECGGCIENNPALTGTKNKYGQHETVYFFIIQHIYLGVDRAALP
jgi:hypothetical protein